MTDKQDHDTWQKRQDLDLNPYGGCHIHSHNTLKHELAKAVVCYVLSENSVYGRLLDHGRGSVRQPSIIQVYPPVAMYGVSFGEREFNYALRVRNKSGCVVWTDGECYF